MILPPKARRYVSRIHAAARIETEWKPAPGAGKVRKRLRKRFRQQIRERLRTEETPSQTKVDYAKRLLDGRDPATVVAVLLDLAQPEPARAPMEVSESAQTAAPGPREAAPGYVRFTINWGERRGAAPNRILGHVCRRGQIRGHNIGEIEVGFDESTFDVAADAADRFERSARRPDERDPHLRIVRASARDTRRPGQPRPKRGERNRQRSRD